MYLTCPCVIFNRYVDYFTIPTHNLTDYSESGVTYHPSRLMGLADILNTVTKHTFTTSRYKLGNMGLYA